MNLLEAIKARHAVRHFTDQTIEGDVKAALMEKLDACQMASGLNLQLVLGEPRAFAGPLARYGKFQNCKNYLVLAGPRGSDEAMGYYGQQIVLKAQQLGLNSCWVGLTYGKSKGPGPGRVQPSSWIFGHGPGFRRNPGRRPGECFDLFQA